MSKSVIGWLALIFLSAFLTTGTLLVLRQGEAQSVASETASAPELPIADASSVVKAQARVVPLRSMELHFPTKGTTPESIVSEVLVQEGDRVEQGAPLARLDTRDLQLRVEEAQAALAQAKANYERLRAEAETAKLRAEAEIAGAQAEIEATNLRAQADAAKLRADASSARALGRFDTAAALEASAQSTLQAASAHETSVWANQEKLAAALGTTESSGAANIASAMAQVQQAEVVLKRAELALDQATLKAPMAGTVMEVNLTVGQMPSLTTPAIVLADLSSWQLEINNLTDRNIVRIQDGDPAAITFSALPDLELPGRVSHIKPIGKFTSPDANISYTVIVTPEQQDERLRWNMTASVAIAPDETSVSQTTNPMLLPLISSSTAPTALPDEAPTPAPNNNN